MGKSGTMMLNVSLSKATRVGVVRTHVQYKIPKTKCTVALLALSQQATAVKVPRPHVSALMHTCI